MVAITYTFSIQDPEYRLLILFLVVFLRSLLADDVAGLGAFALAAGLAGFYLLVKFSLGFTSLADSSSLVAGWCDGQRWRWLASPRRPSPPPGASWVAGSSPREAFSGVRSYISTGWEMSQGLLVGHEPFSLSGGGSTQASSSCGSRCSSLWLFWWPTPRNRIALVGLALPLFAAWKHSMVRQDEHVAILARFGLFVTVVLLVESARVWRFRYTLPAAAALALLVVVPWMTLSLPAYAVTASEMVVSPVAFRGVRDLVEGGCSRRVSGHGGPRVAIGAGGARLPEGDAAAHRRENGGRVPVGDELRGRQRARVGQPSGPRLLQWVHHGARSARCRHLSGARPARVRGVALRLPGGRGEHRRETRALG